MPAKPAPTLGIGTDDAALALPAATLSATTLPPLAHSLRSPTTAELLDLEFGTGSIFDAEVSSADAFPFELPVAHYLDEALLGMYGAPSGKDGAANGSSKWNRIRRTLATDAARGICTALVWVCASVLVGTIKDGPLEELRKNLAHNWFLLTLEIGRVVGSSISSGANRDFLLEAIPTVMVQTAYRLLVDAFPPEQNQLMQSFEVIIEKLTHIIHHDIAGFQINMRTAHKLRQRLFREHVIKMPFANLHESVRNAKRRERLESHKDQNPLAFGSDLGQSLEEMQLEHVLELRERDKVGAHGSSPSRLAALSRKSVVATSSVPEELSVDRYGPIANKAEDLLARQLQELFPDNNDQIIATNAKNRPEELGPEAASGLSPSGEGSPVSMTESPTAQSPTGARRSFMMRSSKASLLGTTALRAQRERERLQAVERRRRDELLERRIAQPLPDVYCQRTINTNLVSPILDKLSSNEGTRSQLLKRSSENQKLRMAPPVAAFLPQIDELPPGKSNHTSDATKVLPAISHGGPRPSKFKSANVGHEAAMLRLSQHADSFRSTSFEQYRKDYDLITGLKKQRIDEDRLRRDEQGYINGVQQLVGSRSAPALRLPRIAGSDAKNTNAQSNSKNKDERRVVKRSSSGVQKPSAGFGAQAGDKPWNKLTVCVHWD